jgi:hypothetical protein
MSTLLQIASRVEAAIKAYNAVRDFAEKRDWVEGLGKELVSAHMRGAFTRRFDRHCFEIERCQDRISEDLG